MQEGHFENLLNYPSAYLEYLTHFHGDRDWFECHEILEEFWKEEGMKNTIWVGLIQIAVGLYHQRRGNAKGALKMIRSSLAHLHKNEVEKLGLNFNRLIASLENRIEEIETGIPFTDFNLPIADPMLVEKCKLECEKMNLTWQGESRMHDEFLVHKHTLRDRSDVIEARELSRREKRKNNGD